MTSIVDEVATGRPVMGKPKRRRRVLVLRVVVGVVVVAIAGVVTGGLVYVNTYQPWQPGTEWGLGHLIDRLTDGTRTTALIDVSAPKQAAWYGLTMRLGGSHDVTILRGTDDAFETIKWQVFSTQQLGDPANATTRAVAVHPGEFVTFWLILRRPACTPGGSEWMTAISFRWSAMGVRHVQVVPITDGHPTPLYTCYPPDVFKHLYPGETAGGS